MSKLLTMVFLGLGFIGYVVYLFVNTSLNGVVPADHIGWFVFDVLIFGAIIVGSWVKKANPIVIPCILVLVVVNLAVNSIDHLADFARLNDPDYGLFYWWHSLKAVTCFLALIAFLLTYLLPKQAKILNLIGIVLLFVSGLSFMAAAIFCFAKSGVASGIWYSSLFLIWLGLVFCSLYVQNERQPKAA
ncbi:MAG: hypothetical protein LKM30_07305 [Bacilli bacterium]|nr:hypothetical protein [Bacilli bacterium]